MKKHWHQIKVILTIKTVLQKKSYAKNYRPTIGEKKTEELPSFSNNIFLLFKRQVSLRMWAEKHDNVSLKASSRFFMRKLLLQKSAKQNLHQFSLAKLFATKLYAVTSVVLTQNLHL